jgi:hypothetical protein
MIRGQVLLIAPCYDFCPVQATAITAVSNTVESLNPTASVPAILEATQSRAATGGVYKGQGRNQFELMTQVYWEFLVHGQ